MRINPVQILRHRAFVALVDQAAVSVASFGTGILLSRSFSGRCPEQLGLYYLAVTIGILIVEVQNALVSTPLTVTVPTLSPDRLRQSVGSALIHQGWLSIAITASLLILAAISPAIGIPSHRPMLFACAGTAGAVGLRNFARFLNFSLHRPHVAAVADWIVTALQLGGIVLLAQAGRLSAWTAVCSIGVASLAGGFVALLLSRQFIRTQFRLAWGDFKHNWQLSRWVFASGVIGNVGVNLYTWVLDTFSSILQTAVWGNCNTVSSAGNPVLMGLQNWMAPAIAHACADRPRPAFQKYVAKMAAVFMLILPPMLVGLAIVTAPLLHRLYKDESPGTTLLVLVLAAGSLVQASGFIFTRGLFSLGRGATDVGTNFIPVAVLVLAGLPLVYQFGAIGGAFSLLIAQVLTTIVRGRLFWNACVVQTESAGDAAIAESMMPAAVEAA